MIARQMAIAVAMMMDRRDLRIGFFIGYTTCMRGLAMNDRTLHTYTISGYFPMINLNGVS